MKVEKGKGLLLYQKNLSACDINVFLNYSLDFGGTWFGCDTSHLDTAHVCSIVQRFKVEVSKLPRRLEW